MICHQENGLGVEDTYPPLAGSDFLLKNKIKSIKIILNGSKSSIIVNGQRYTGGSMPNSGLKTQQITDVMNYKLPAM